LKLIFMTSKSLFSSKSWFWNDVVPEMTKLSVGSTQMILTPSFFIFRYFLTLHIVPEPTTNKSTLPVVSFQISGPAILYIYEALYVYGAVTPVEYISWDKNLVYIWSSLRVRFNEFLSLYDNQGQILDFWYRNLQQHI
jgi:hypothetical protein